MTDKHLALTARANTPAERRLTGEVVESSRLGQRIPCVIPRRGAASQKSEKSWKASSPDSWAILLCPQSQFRGCGEELRRREASDLSLRCSAGRFGDGSVPGCSQPVGVGWGPTNLSTQTVDPDGGGGADGRRRRWRCL